MLLTRPLELLHKLLPELCADSIGRDDLDPAKWFPGLVDQRIDVGEATQRLTERTGRSPGDLFNGLMGRQAPPRPLQHWRPPMSSSAVLLLATGRDRPGLVDQVSGLIYEAGCNLEDSRMAILGGEFSLMVLATGAPESLARLVAGVPRLEKELDLFVKVKETVAGQSQPKGSAPHLRCRLDAVAMDHPGIVHRLTRLLHEHQINVARLDTTRSSAPITGTPMFAMEMDLDVPAQVSLAALRSQLVRWAEAANIDLDFRVER